MKKRLDYFYIFAFAVLALLLLFDTQPNIDFTVTEIDINDLDKIESEWIEDISEKENFSLVRCTTQAPHEVSFLLIINRINYREFIIGSTKDSITISIRYDVNYSTRPLENEKIFKITTQSSDLAFIEINGKRFDITSVKCMKNNV
jgi:hypothetical protein